MLARRKLECGMAVLITTLMAASAGSAVPPQPLDLAAAIAMARQNNRRLAAAGLRIQESHGDLTEASILLVDNPDLAADAGPRLPRAGGSETTVDLAIGIEQRIEIGGQRSYRIDRAHAQVAAATANTEDLRRTIELGIAIAFYSSLAAERRLQLLAENEHLAHELYNAAQRRLDAGEGTPLEVNTSRIRLAEAQRRSVGGSAARQAAAVRFAELLGLAPTTAFALQGDLPEPEAAPSADSLVARAARARPDLVAAAHEIDAAAAAIELADAEAWPDIEVGVSYSREENDEIVTGGLRMPIPLFNRNQGKKERERQTRARRVAERDALALSVESEVRRALLAYEQARSALHIYDAEVLRAQEESLTLLQRAFQAGDVGIPDVIVVQREVIESREAYLNSRLELARARAAVLAAASLPQTTTLQGDLP